MKHDIVGATQKTMPDAQIPIMIMTPNNSCLSTYSMKINKHPNWQPYAFEAVDMAPNVQADAANEYAKYRRFLIQKEKEFVAKQSASSDKVKAEEAKKQMENLTVADPVAD